MSPRARRARRAQARAVHRAGAGPSLPGVADWLGVSPHAVAAVILVVALGLRAYYFTLTKDQPLWWDEAEYMLKAKAMALGTPDTGWWVARPVVLSVLAAALFKLGLGEVTIRVLWVVLSTATLALVYGLAARLFNARVGLYALVLASVSYLDVFYTMRLLVDGPPQVFFVTLAAFLLTWLPPGRWGGAAIGGVFPALAIGAGLRFTAAIFVPVVIVFLLLTRGFAVLRDRAWHVSMALAGVVALPMLLYFWRSYGNPFAPFFSHMVLRGGLSSGGGIVSRPTAIFMDYVRYLPEFTTPLLTAALVAGLIQAIVLVARHWERRREDRVANGSLLLVLWVVIPFLFYGVAVNTFQDRFLSVMLPAVFILIGTALDAAWGLARRWSPALAVAPVVVFVLYGAVEMARRTDFIVRGQIESYRGVADAGHWIRTLGTQAGAVLSSSVPQTTYYAERPTFNFPGEERDLPADLAERQPAYMVLSVWEQSPAWVYDWPKRNPDKVSVAAAFYPDPERTQVSAVVYAFGAPGQHPR